MIKKILFTFFSLIIFTSTAFTFDIDTSQLDFLTINTSSEMQQYIIPVGKKIISNFDMPDTNQNYSTIVEFRIDNNGKLTDLKITQSSGNKDYDNRVLTAVKKSEPFPAHNFSPSENDHFLLNMDLGVIKLIKMLSGLESDIMNMDLNQLLQNEQPPIEEKQAPKGKKFVNPYEIEKSLE